MEGWVDVGVKKGNAVSRSGGFVEEALFEQPVNSGLANQTRDGEHVFWFNLLADDELALVWDGVAHEPFKAGALQPNGLMWTSSSEGRHIAYFAVKGGRWHVGVDTELGPPFQALGTQAAPVFSGDGSRVAYVAVVQGASRLIVDGRTDYDFFCAVGQSPVFSPDGQRLAYAAQGRGEAGFRVVLDGAAGPEFDALGSATVGGEEVSSFQFSADSRRFSYHARRGRKWIVVLDGEVGPEFDALAWPTFSPDGERFAYLAIEGSRCSVVLDGSPGPWFEKDKVGRPVFSPDSRRVAYAVVEGGKHRMILDGEKGPAFDHIWWFGSTPRVGYRFSPDSQHFAYLARTGKGVLRGSRWRCFAVLDGQSGPEFDDVSPLFAEPDFRAAATEPRFSPDSSHLAFAAQHDKAWSIVADGLPGPGFHLVGPPAYAPSGSRLAYMAKVDKKRTLIVVDGQAGPVLDDVYASPHGDAFSFSPEGTHVAYAGQIGDAWHPVVDGQLGPAYGGALFPTFADDGKPRFIAKRGETIYRVVHDA